MKKQILFTRNFLIVLLISGLLVPYVTAQSILPMVDRQKTSTRLSRLPDQINNSIVNYVSPDRVATSTPFDICFTVTVNSLDSEYMDRFDIDLPDAWTVHSVTPHTGNGCGTAVPPVSGVEAGNVLYWQSKNYPPATACGAWSNGTYQFCANITVPDCTSEPWTLPWNIIGDGYGGLPHTTFGEVGPVRCKGTGLFISPETFYDVGCTSVQTYTLNLANNTGADDTFNLSYSVYGDNATLSGPDQIYLGAGVDQDFLVDLTPNACLAPGTPIFAYIQASGGGYLRISLIAKRIAYGCARPGCPTIYLPSVFNSN